MRESAIRRSFSAATVGEALGGLTSEFAELRKHLFTEEGKLRSFVNVYLNDEDIRYLAKEEHAYERRRHHQHHSVDRRRMLPRLNAN